MNEQELIIQGNQASVLMPKLKRYVDEQIVALSGGVASKAYVDAQIAALSAGVASKVWVDEQIAALAEKDKDTLFINFNEVSPSEEQTLLYIQADEDFVKVYNNAYIPEDDQDPPDGGNLGSIAQGIYDKYHESYPLLTVDNVAKKVVDGCIVLAPSDDRWEDIYPWDTPYLRLGYSPYHNEADAIEQHLGWLRRSTGTDEEGDVFFDFGFLTRSNIPLYIREVTVSYGTRNVCLKGWMLLKNS